MQARTTPASFPRRGQPGSDRSHGGEPGLLLVLGNTQEGFERFPGGLVWHRCKRGQHQLLFLVAGSQVQCGQGGLEARGLAEASVIEAQGKATAEAMRVKAESFKQYNEAAVVEMIKDRTSAGEG